MGIITTLFDKLKKLKKRTKRTKNFFITNSAEFGFGEIELAIAGKIRVDGILAISALHQIAKEKNENFEYSVMHTTLLEEGALTIPVVFTFGSKKYSIYFIYKEEELLKYYDLIDHITQTPYPNLIYFSSIPLSSVSDPTPIIEPFQLADLRYDKEAIVAGKFAMWWSTERDPFFHKSEVFNYLAKLNELIRGYETYMVGYVLRQTRIINETELKRMKLPESNSTFIIDGPEEKKVLLDISKEKGIRFLFNINDTSVEYRERFIKGVVIDFIANIIPLRQQNFPTDEITEPNSYDWFQVMAKAVKKMEENDDPNGLKIGYIEYNVNMN